MVYEYISWINLESTEGDVFETVVEFIIVTKTWRKDFSSDC